MAGPSTRDAEKVAALREALPAAGAGIYLNAPLAGPLPAESAAAMTEIADWELRTGRANRDRDEDVAFRVDEARAAVAAVLAADLDEVELVNGIGDAFTSVTRIVELEKPDRIAVVPDPAFEPFLARLPSGVEPYEIDPSTGAPLLAGTRLVATPLVRATTGERLPVERLATAAHEAGSRIAVEASLAVGAVPVDWRSLHADLLVVRSGSWLLGPEGLAVVAGPEVAVARRSPRPDEPVHLPSVVGLARGCGWLSMYVGLPWIHARGAALTARLADHLVALERVELLTPPTRATTLVFRIAGWAAADALEELGARVFLLAAAVEELDAIRVGVGFWNTEGELDRLADAVGLLAAHTPASLPRRPRLAILGQG